MRQVLDTDEDPGPAGFPGNAHRLPVRNAGRDLQINRALMALLMQVDASLCAAIGIFDADLDLARLTLGLRLPTPPAGTDPGGRAKNG